MTIFVPPAGVTWTPLSVIGPVAVYTVPPSLGLVFEKQVPARPTAVRTPAVTLPVAQATVPGSGGVVGPVTVPPSGPRRRRGAARLRLLDLPGGGRGRALRVADRV